MKLFQPLDKRQSSGFTLIELLIICPILMAIIAFMMNYLFNQYGQLVSQNAKVNLQVGAQSAIFSLQDDIFFSNAFVSDLNDNLSDTWAPSGGWHASANPTVFIMSTPALTASHRKANREPVYINTLGCTPNSVKEQNDALYNNIVVWVSGSNLYKRVVSAPSNLATCGSSWQKQTCPVGHTSSSCPADILLTDKLSSFSVLYYDSNGTQVSTPEQANAVKLTINLADTAYAENVTGSSSITVRRLNK